MVSDLVPGLVMGLGVFEENTLLEEIVLTFVFSVLLLNSGIVPARVPTAMRTLE